MNLIYLRNRTPKTRKFMRRKLRGGERASIYDIAQGDYSLPPAYKGRNDRIVTFVNDVSPEMLDFIYASASRAALALNLN
jgi:hypothetical protein